MPTLRDLCFAIPPGVGVASSLIHLSPGNDKSTCQCLGIFQCWSSSLNHLSLSVFFPYAFALWLMAFQIVLEAQVSQQQLSSSSASSSSSRNICVITHHHHSYYSPSLSSPFSVSTYPALTLPFPTLPLPCPLVCLNTSYLSSRNNPLEMVAWMSPPLSLHPSRTPRLLPAPLPPVCCTPGWPPPPALPLALEPALDGPQPWVDMPVRLASPYRRLEPGPSVRHRGKERALPPAPPQRPRRWASKWRTSPLCSGMWLASLRLWRNWKKWCWGKVREAL